MKKVLKYGLIAIALLVIFSFWYKWKYSMGVKDGFTVNKPTIENKLLLATQQSEYKDKVTQLVADHFIGKDIYISVIDVTQLNQSLINDYQAFVIIHTYEMWNPPKQVVSFLQSEDIKNKVFTVSTSGDGNLIPENVDGITSASIILDAEKDANKVIEWINDQFTLET